MQDQKPLENQFNTPVFRVLLVIGIIVNLLPIGSTIIEPDSALYAVIAKTMVLKGDWVNLYVQGSDWLDKPHFPFWATALSFKIFGIHSFAYRLPAIFFWLVGAWYTWKFACWQYSRAVGQLALLIYLTSLHLVISNNDVRAEPYLTGMLIAAVYHFAKAGALLPTRRVPPDGWIGIFAGFTRRVAPDGWKISAGWHLVAGASFTAMAVMTKGIFILIPLGGGFVAYWIYKGDWQQFTRTRWWVAIFLVALLILPELYCLYVQFDLHPEKTIFGRQGVSGIRFFFWDSQFGRFLNNGPIKGKGDPFFFLHTLLWAFLPWSIPLYLAVYQRIRALFKKSKPNEYSPGAGTEQVSLFIALISFLLFSASRFQLPHYLNIVFPFFAILTASWIVGHPPVGWHPTGGEFRRGGGWWNRRGVLVGVSISALLLYSLLNLVFYPGLLKYQSGSKAADWLGKHYPNEPVYTIGPHSYSLELYAKPPVIATSRDELLFGNWEGSRLVYTSREQADTLVMNARTKLEHKLPHYHITKLKIGFLLPAKRLRYLEERVLIRVYENDRK